MPVQRFNDRVKVKVKNDPDIWMILEHETVRKGATTKVTGKVKFFSEKSCELA